MRHTIRWLALVGVLPMACGGVTDPVGSGAPPSPGDVDAPAPLTEMGPATYKGFAAGLYPGGNAPPIDHAAAGAARVRRLELLDRSGAASPDGRIAMLSIGMSNTTREFCKGPVTSCAPWSFVGQALADPAVDQTRLALVDGAVGGHPATDWDAPEEPVYDRVRDRRLVPLGLTEAQVQVVWLKQANARPAITLPAPDADAYALEAALGRIVRALAARYPNLQIVFVSSRIYAGYATTTLNPEPFAFESGLSVKWLIEAQIDQSRTGVVDTESGDLGLDFGTPWIGWGPYLWADGETARQDGLTWSPEDFEADGTHPSRSGEEKVGGLLLDFFKTDPMARCWFLATGRC